MKRIAALIAALLLLSSFATAEELPSALVKFIADYNVYADTVFNVPHLPLTGWKKGSFENSFDLDFDGMRISVDTSRYAGNASFIIEAGDLDIDFIAKCACFTAALRGQISKDMYADLLTVYFKMRMEPGKHETLTNASGTIIMSNEREEIIIFMVGK